MQTHGRRLSVSLNFCLYSHSVWNSSSLRNTNSTKSFFLSHFQDNLWEGGLGTIGDTKLRAKNQEWWEKWLRTMHCLKNSIFVRNFHCSKNVQIRSFFWSVFSRIRTKYRDSRGKPSYSVKYGKLRSRKNSVFGHFSCSTSFYHNKAIFTSRISEFLHQDNTFRQRSLMLLDLFKLNVK